MRRLRPAFAAALVLVAARAHAACPPPEALLQGVRSASRIQVEQLGSDATRVETTLAHVPGRTLGYEVQGVFRVSGPAADALQRAFGRHDSYACDPATARATFRTPGALRIGLLFTAGGHAVAAVLRLPEGVLELQREGDERASAPLSQAGQRRWEEALTLLSRQTRTSPEEFYEQMLPPVRVPPAPADTAPDTSRAPRDGMPAPR